MWKKKKPLKVICQEMMYDGYKRGSTVAYDECIGIVKDYFVELIEQNESGASEYLKHNVEIVSRIRQRMNQ